MNQPHINDLRSHLMATLADLRDKKTPMDTERARAVAHVASVLVDTAKVEVDYLRATGQQRADFMEHVPQLPGPDGVPSARNPLPTPGITGIRRHRMEDDE